MHYYILFTLGSEEDFNDQLTLRDGETYFSLLRVTNVDGYRYELHSDGVTIQSHPLVKGWVYDGGIAGYDLNILPSASTVSCHWNGFGDTSSIAQAGTVHLMWDYLLPLCKSLNIKKHVTGN